MASDITLVKFRDVIPSGFSVVPSVDCLTPMAIPTEPSKFQATPA
jgi:hypothetical protein